MQDAGGCARNVRQQMKAVSSALRNTINAALYFISKNYLLFHFLLLRSTLLNKKNAKKESLDIILL